MCVCVCGMIVRLSPVGVSSSSISFSELCGLSLTSCSCARLPCSTFTVHSIRVCLSFPLPMLSCCSFSWNSAVIISSSVSMSLACTQHTKERRCNEWVDCSLLVRCVDAGVWLFIG